jgi:hypothetical protein
MWGHSWKEYKDNIFIHDLNYTEYLYLSNIIHPYPINNKNISNKNICYQYNYQQNLFKIKIVHIMGLFFTGGIERYLYYIDKYGNHNKYEYYIICIKKDDNYAYPIKNIKIIPYSYFDRYHLFINEILISKSKKMEKKTLQNLRKTLRQRSTAGAGARLLGPARPQAGPLVDKESKSISFFCCSLYTDELGVFMQKKYNVCLSVRPVQSVSVNPKSGMNILLGVRSEPKTH